MSEKQYPESLKAAVADLHECQQDVCYHAYDWLIEVCGDAPEQALDAALGVADEIKEVIK